MDSPVQSSFIPKKPLEGSGYTSRGRGGGIFGNLFLFVGIFVFIVSLAAAGAAFAYQNYLTSSIAGKVDSLQKAEAAFDPAVIADLVRLDSRINQAQLLLQKHISSSAIFNFLSLQTLQQVQFSSFDYALADDGSAGIKLSGIADSFSTVALQSDQFSASKVFKDVVFSAITIDSQTGKVSFTVDGTIDASLINYAKNLGTAAATQTPAPQTSSPAVASTTPQ